MGGQMGGVRFVVLASIAAGAVVGHETALAQGGSEHVETLPPVEVTAPAEGAKRGRSREATRIVRPRPRVIIPTAPAATAGSASDIDADKVPASVNVVDSKQIERTGSPNITDALLQSVPSVNISEVSGNPFTPNLEFRGFVASPVSGTPQGLAVYQNGVRINEAFGDTINWDLIPTLAIKSVAVVTNNPAFGLNALGGAVDVQMKDGFSYHGTELSVMGGSFGRIQGSGQWGKQIDNNYAVYGALEGIHDDGFRNFSQSDIRRFYGDVAYRNDVSEFHLNMGAADNKFGATATVPAELLQNYWGATYTTPQTSHNQVGYFNLTGKVEATPTWTIEGAAHLRFFKQSTEDANPTGTQPCDDPTLLCFGDSSTPAFGLNGVQLSNPFPDGSFLGENDRTSTRSTTAGLSLQATNDDKLFGHDNRFTVGTSLDTSVTWFNASAELGTFGPDYVMTGSGIFLGPSGSPVTDGPVSLRATNQYFGLYALDTFDVTDRLSISGGGRFNTANISLQDQLGTALNGNHEYDRFNPMIGGTYKITRDVTLYGGYSEANRAPTPLELSCADPANPCTIATFLVSDPDLKQVVSHTFEAGLRGSKELNIGTLSWKLGGFRATNTDDILAIASPVLQGFGYYQNVGSTRRQGFEAEIDVKSKALQVYASYAFIDARFLDSLTVGSNSPFADANGNIQISPGNQIPGIPRHRIKAGFDYNVTDAFKIGGDALWVSSQYFVGDESNQFSKLPSYAVFNAHASYQIDKTYQIFGRIDNIFDNRYSTWGTFFQTDALPNFTNGQAFSDPRSLSPARPRAFYVGMKATF
ncbi:TonB-dependent receptor [Bradyrhizobium jicamae]|uniref:TonB-dependent receptor n=1 Tax=Bradyrhizobium jicamae TaxID=280332 RepID=A0ABS5FGJ8_9BRAD|nr:TonB-dependent receptor [Bradyrhizobium jicamae]MBR0795911.1 TonB-dependent receptor [Bradyrhizobium jicamae]MBR0935595.1 TonB-dependent receptor [Bradyrhizobium jicamae]